MLIPLDQLHPHPDNPRLIIRQEVVDGIAAAIKNGFPAKYALVARPVDGGYQIIAGHHRRLAAIQAGLEAVPCWVEAMSDEEAFLELVRSNRQSELSPLEHGLHALKATERASKKGRSIKDYAETVGRPERSVNKEVAAARVAQSSPMSAKCADKVHHLAELHAASPWLWPALVAALVAEGWTVETARSHVARLRDVPEPPSWADHEEIAAAIVAGTFRPGDMARMAKVAAGCPVPATGYS